MAAFFAVTEGVDRGDRGIDPAKDLLVDDGSRCGLVQFKLCAHFLDLRGLLLKLCRESLYLFVLLRDRCLQLLNFEIEHGLAAVFGILGNSFGLVLGNGLELALRNGYGQPVSIGTDDVRA
jgi:hypothetical protein